jgi:hypothetical protein
VAWARLAEAVLALLRPILKLRNNNHCKLPATAERNLRESFVNSLLVPLGAEVVIKGFKPGTLSPVALACLLYLG